MHLITPSLPRPRFMVMAVVIVLALMALLSTPASAHVEPASSEPAADAVIMTSPTQVVVVFDGEIGETGSVLEVYGPDGVRVDNNDVALDLDDMDRRRMTATLQPNLPDGVYQVRAGGASIDGHEPELAEFSFTIAAAGGTLGPVSLLATPQAATPVATPLATPVATPAGGATTLSGGGQAAAAAEATQSLPIWSLVVLALVPALLIGLAVRSSRRHDAARS